MLPFRMAMCSSVTTASTQLKNSFPIPAGTLDGRRLSLSFLICQTKALAQQPFHSPQAQVLMFSDDSPCACSWGSSEWGTVSHRGTWDYRKEMPHREVRGILGKTTCRSSLVITLRTLTTHLVLPAVAARSQHHGTAQEAHFCLAVCTEAKPGVVELKVDIHTEVNPALRVKTPSVGCCSSPSLSGV